MSDLIERLNRLCERHNGVRPSIKWHVQGVNELSGDYSVGAERFVVATVHNAVSASDVIFGRDPVAQISNAHAIADVPTMLATIREAAAELERLQTSIDVVNGDYIAMRQRAETAEAELVCLTAESARYRSAIRWALGYDEGEPEFEPPEGDRPRYWWRKELRRRAGDDDAAMTKEPTNG